MARDALKKYFGNRPREGRFCPFLRKPFDDCLCLNMDSQKTFGVLYFCRANFQECEIYRKHHPAIKTFEDPPMDGGKD